MSYEDFNAWTTKEKFILACCVTRNGDQNWGSVSRMIKLINEACGGESDHRPTDWFSQKNCAIKYNELLATVSSTKRKSRAGPESTNIETPAEQIVRKLTFARIEELNQSVALERERFKKLKDDLVKIQSGKVNDQLPKIWEAIQSGEGVELEKLIKVEAPPPERKKKNATKASSSASNVASGVTARPQRATKETEKFKSYIEQLQKHNAKYHHQHTTTTSTQTTTATITTTVAASSIPSTTSSLPTTLLSATKTIVTQASTIPKSSAIKTDLESPRSILSPLRVPSSRSEKKIIKPSFDQITIDKPSPKKEYSSSNHSKGLLIIKPDGMKKSPLASPTTIVKSKEKSFLSNLLTTTTTEIKAQVNQLNEKLKEPVKGINITKESYEAYKKAQPLPPSPSAPMLAKLLEENNAPASSSKATTQEIPLQVCQASNIKSSEAPSSVEQAKKSQEPLPLVPHTSKKSLETQAQVIATPKKIQEPHASTVQSPKEKKEHHTLVPKPIKKSQEHIAPTVQSPKKSQDHFAPPTQSPKKSQEHHAFSLQPSKESKESHTPVSKFHDKSKELHAPTIQSAKKSQEHHTHTVQPPNKSQEQDRAPVVKTSKKSQEQYTSIALSPTKSEVDNPPLTQLPTKSQEPHGPIKLSPKKSLESKKLIDPKKTVAINSKSLLEKQPQVKLEPASKPLKKEAVSTDKESKGGTFSSALKTALEKNFSKDMMEGKKPASAKNTSETSKVEVKKEVPKNTTKTKEISKNAETKTHDVVKIKNPSDKEKELVSKEPKVKEEKGNSTEPPIKKKVVETSPHESPEVIIIASESPIELSPKVKKKGKGRSRGGNKKKTNVTVPLNLDLSTEDDSSQTTDEHDISSSSRDDLELNEDLIDKKNRTPLTPSLSSPASPALSVGSNCDPEIAQQQRAWRKSIMLVWKAAASHKYANVFMHPVTDEEAPGYSSIIFKPMDLSTIKKNIETGITTTTTEFQRDVMLMFQNALMYNRKEHDVYRMAQEMRDDVMVQIQSFISTQLMVQTTEREQANKAPRGKTEAIAPGHTRQSSKSGFNFVAL